MPGILARIGSAWLSLLSYLRPEEVRQTEAWRARREHAVQRRHKPTYDAYPDAPYRPRVRIVLLAENLMETVDLDGYSLREINIEVRWRREWLVKRLHEAHVRLVERLEAQRAARASRNTPSSSP